MLVTWLDTSNNQAAGPSSAGTQFSTYKKADPDRGDIFSADLVWKVRELEEVNSVSL